MLDEEMKQVEAGNGAVLGPWTLEHGWSVTLESRPCSSSKSIGKISHQSGLPVQIGGPHIKRERSFRGALPQARRFL